MARHESRRIGGCRVRFHPGAPWACYSDGRCRMRRTMALGAALCTSIVVLSCRDGTSPIAGLSVTFHSPDTVHVGDSAIFQIVVANSATDTISIGIGCPPPSHVVVRSPDGTVVWD